MPAIVSILRMISVIFLVGGGLLGSAYALTPPAGGAVSAGRTHVLSVKSNGTVWAWGSNYYGELGDGTTHDSLSIPVRATGATGSLTGMVAITAGDSHSLALKADGTVWAWGSNFSAQLGDGTTVDRHAAVQVQTATGFLSGVSALSAGTTHSLAVKADGTAWAWGENRFGQLGDGTTLLRPQAIQVQGLTGYLTGVVSVAAGHMSSYAMKNDGTVWAWGSSHAGGLGDGTTTDRLWAVQVQGPSAPLSGVVAVAAGSLHAVALKSDGTVWAWGNNDHGQLGDGTLTTRLKAVSVKGPAGPLTGIVAIAAGGAHNLALKSDGTIWAWGADDLSELGSSSATVGSDQAIAVPVDGSPFADVVSIAAGGSRSMMIKSDGTVWMWGNQFRMGGPIDTMEIRTWPTPTQQTIQLITDPSDTGDDPPGGGGDTGDVTGGAWGTTPGNADLNVAYTYDALGRVQSETSNGVTHVYGYDLAGNRVHVTYGGTGTALTSEYDVLNRLHTLTENGRTTTYGYDLNGNIVKLTLSNGDVTEKTYDALNRNVLITDKTSASVVLATHTQTYDSVGNAVKIVDSYPGRDQMSRTLINTYDEINRLLSESLTLATFGYQGTTVFTYDKANNRASMTPRGSTTPVVYTSNTCNQLVSTTAGDAYTYDFNGSRLTHSRGGNTDTYVYDFENRLVQLTKTIPDSTTTLGTYTYAYDYRTRRVERNESGASGQVTKLVFSGGTSVQEIESSAVTVEYVRGSDYGGGVGGVLYTLRSAVPSYSHYNQRGDVVMKTDTAGTMKWIQDYEAFGKRYAEFQSGGFVNLDRQKANTKDEDPTGLLNEGFRYRDLDTGTFITRDPLGFVDGPNMYAYVVQNPWSKFDPEGLSSTPVLDATIGILQALAAPVTVAYNTVAHNDQLTTQVANQWMADSAASEQSGRNGTLGALNRFNPAAQVYNGVAGEDLSNNEHLNTEQRFQNGASGVYGLALIAAPGIKGPGGVPKPPVVAPSPGVPPVVADASAINAASKATAGGTTPAPTASLPDNAVVVRGGTCKPGNFATGSGVTTDAAGNVQNVSVNSAPGKTAAELSTTVPNNQVGTTTVGAVRAAGGNVVPKPTLANPDHAVLGGVTAQQASELMQPTIRNPAK